MPKALSELAKINNVKFLKTVCKFDWKMFNNKTETNINKIVQTVSNGSTEPPRSMAENV